MMAAAAQKYRGANGSRTASPLRGVDGHDGHCTAMGRGADRGLIEVAHAGAHHACHMLDMVAVEPDPAGVAEFTESLPPSLEARGIATIWEGNQKQNKF